MSSSSLSGHTDDERAFHVLLERHRGGLEVFCVRMLGDPQQADHGGAYGLAGARACARLALDADLAVPNRCPSVLGRSRACDEFARGRSLDGLNRDENTSGQL